MEKKDTKLPRARLVNPLHDKEKPTEVWEKKLALKDKQIEQLEEELKRTQIREAACRIRARKERELRELLTMQLSEQRKLATEMAKKSPEVDLIAAIRKFLNYSARKKADKRAYAKEMARDFVDLANIELPEDVKEILLHLDDELPEARVVNVSGNYNDIHDNGEVNLKK